MLRAAPLLLLLAVPASAAPPTPEQITEGWVMLFDGETTFGWKVEGEAKVEGGKLVLGGDKKTTAKTTTRFGACKLVFDFEPADGATLLFQGNSGNLPNLGKELHEGEAQATTAKDGASVVYTVETSKGGVGGGWGPNFPRLGVAEIGFSVPAGKRLTLSRVWLKPLETRPLFNGKDLTGWKEFPERKSKFAVTKEGFLNVKDGPGDLATVDQFADFALQLECISNGEFLNSGIFFRCIPNEYQQGYEAQIRNQFVGGDRTKPFDFGTGAIYRRQAARKVVPNDREWFTMSVVAHGRHIATWVNGYQTADFTDDRPEADNARKGTKLGKGTISIQGHDPTTDLSFRNIRIAELPPAK